MRRSRPYIATTTSKVRPASDPASRVVVVRIGVHVHDPAGVSARSCGPAVQDRDVVTAVDEALHERDPGRTGAADDQHPRAVAHGPEPTSPTPRSWTYE